MARIHFISVDEGTRRAVQNREYDEEGIIQLNNQMMEARKTRKKAFSIVMIIVAVLLLGGGIVIYGSTIGFPDALPLVLFNLLAFAIIFPVTWYASIGREAKQWDDLMSVYYPSVYMENKYGKQDEQPQEDPRPEKKTKTPVNGKDVLKKAYYIITIILAVLVVALLMLVAITGYMSRRTIDDLSSVVTSILFAVTAIGCLILSVEGLRKNSAVGGIILEKVGTIFFGFGVIVIMLGVLKPKNLLQALILFVPAALIGAACFVAGNKVIKKRQNIQRFE